MKQISRREKREIIKLRKDRVPVSTIERALGLSTAVVENAIHEARVEEEKRQYSRSRIYQPHRRWWWPWKF